MRRQKHRDGNVVHTQCTACIEASPDAQRLLPDRSRRGPAAPMTGYHVKLLFGLGVMHAPFEVRRHPIIAYEAQDPHAQNVLYSSHLPFSVILHRASPWLPVTFSISRVKSIALMMPSPNISLAISRRASP